MRHENPLKRPLGPFLGCLLFLSGSVEAEIRGDVQLLAKIARGIQSNYDKIVTWEGTAQAKEFRDGRIQSEFDVAFAYDATQNCMRTNVESLRNGQRQFTSRMLRGDERFSVGPFPTRQSPNQQRRWSAAVIADPKGRVVKLHPIRYVNCVTNVPSFLLMFVENFERFDELDRLIEISQDGPQIVLSLTGGSNRYEFDERVGYNLVRFLAKYPQVEDEWRLEFSSTAPHTPLGWSKSHREFGRETYRQVFQVKQDRVNHQLSEDAFSLRSMGLRTGDSLNDTIRNVMVPLEIESAKQIAKTQGMPWQWWMVTAFAGLAVTLVTRQQVTKMRTTKPFTK